MSRTLRLIQALAAEVQVRFSNHGYDELAADGILATDVLRGLAGATVVADYPDFAKGPCVLVLQHDAEGKEIHCVWGIPKGASGPAVLVTAYRPAADKWTDDFMRRRT